MHITMDGNRYLGEHSCSQHPRGDQTLVRPCCVDDARHWKSTAMRVAMTSQHPAYRLFLGAWNGLTDAERWQVGDLVPVYDHGPAGFVEREMQAALAV